MLVNSCVIALGLYPHTKGVLGVLLKKKGGGGGVGRYLRNEFKLYIPLHLELLIFTLLPY